MAAKLPSAPSLSGFVAPALLRWYDAHRRTLPWRAGPGERADPYRVWLSEVMLQQTTVATVGPRFAAWVARWPDFASLARADEADVMAAWAGLGYYARARNLVACARAVVAGHDGAFPHTESELRALPGIGDYTAAAIAAIAFDEPATVVDANVERVVARLFRLADKAAIRPAAATLTPAVRAGDFAQAMMDLGATICSPRAPQSDSSFHLRKLFSVIDEQRVKRRLQLGLLEHQRGQALVRAGDRSSQAAGSGAKDEQVDLLVPMV